MRDVREMHKGCERGVRDVRWRGEEYEREGRRANIYRRGRDLTSTLTTCRDRADLPLQSKQLSKYTLIIKQTSYQSNILQYHNEKKYSMTD